MTNLQTKVCTFCKKELPLENFYKTKTKFGNPSVSSRCKGCGNVHSKKKYALKQTEKLKVRIESLEGEIWMPVKDYPLYMVSNLARVKRLGNWKYKEVAKKEVYYEEILLSQIIYGGYHCVTLYHGIKYKHPTNVYSLVFFSFNPDVEKVRGYEIDHKDNDKLNSVLSNLQYIKARHNSSKRSLFLFKTSRYTGVCFDKEKNKWLATIRINGRTKYLGRYENEEDAAKAYQRALKTINEIEEYHRNKN